MSSLTRALVRARPGRAVATSVLFLLLTMLVVLLGSLVPAATPPAVAQEGPVPEQDVTLELFWGDGCPHCAAEKEWLGELAQRFPSLTVEQHEVYYDADGRALLETRAREMGFEVSGVPVTIVGDEVFVGFSDATAAGVERAVAAAVAGTPGEASTVVDAAALSVPFVGEVDVTQTSLMVSTLIIGFVDGVNPCSLWVLSVLLAIVLHSGSRGRVVAIGTTFLTVTAFMYALYVTGMYSALDYVGQIGWIRVVIAVVAGVFGVIHLKDFFAFKQGPSLSIADSAKPGIYRRMRRVSAADASVPAMIGGTVVLAVGVSLLETPCTAGLPLLWTSLLAANDVTTGQAIWLFAVYMAVFLLDELVLFFAAVVTLRATKVQEKHGRVLKLVSGSVMVTLSITMLLFPTALESIVGTLVVFGAAAALVLLILLGQRVSDRVASG